VGSSIDLAVALARGAVFITSLQAAGAALFSLLFARYLGPSAGAIRSLTRWSAGLALLLIIVRSALEPARMAGALGGVFDPFLRSLFWESVVSSAQLARLGGAALILISIWLQRRLSKVAGVLGIALVVLSFPLMGHTRSHDSNGLLGALLAVHVFVAAFWFGALLPLLLCMRNGAGPALGELIGAFSRLAVRLVPLLLVAGLLLAWVLLGSISALLSVYALFLLVKLTAVLVLLLLAAANKHKLTPGVAAGEGTAMLGLRRSISAELALMVLILVATAAMTTLYSPG
jgi:putative copper resistance protein D